MSALSFVMFVRLLTRLVSWMKDLIKEAMEARGAGSKAIVACVDGRRRSLMNDELVKEAPSVGSQQHGSSALGDTLRRQGHSSAASTGSDS